MTCTGEALHRREREDTNLDTVAGSLLGQQGEEVFCRGFQIVTARVAGVKAFADRRELPGRQGFEPVCHLVSEDSRERRRPHGAQLGDRDTELSNDLDEVSAGATDR